MPQTGSQEERVVGLVETVAEKGSLVDGSRSLSCRSPIPLAKK